jgi:peptidoglycan/LPS O-acetylase OafA/YrhL
MLVIALTLGPYLYDARLAIDAFRHATLQPPERYLDGTLTNYSTHISFIFGLLPQYAFRTPLPDWSIGLEMQFYAVLPFLMLLIGRLGWIKGTVMIAVAGTVIAVIVSRLGVQFPMPAFLPLKMHMFAAGMLVAAALWMDGKKALLCLAVALAFALVPIGGGQGHKYEVVRLGLTLMFFGLVHARRLPLALGKPVRSVSDLLGSRFCHQLGELSFGVYLLHLLIMQPVMAYLIKNDQLSHVALYLVTLAIVVPTAYALAWVGYNFVEVQGQRVGRLLTKPAVVAV